MKKLSNEDWFIFLVGRCAFPVRCKLPGRQSVNGGWVKFTSRKRCGCEQEGLLEELTAGLPIVPGQEGGAMIDLGVHAIDAAWYLMGNPKPRTVSAQTYQKFPQLVKTPVFDVEDSAYGMIRFEN